MDSINTFEKEETQKIDGLYKLCQKYYYDNVEYFDLTNGEKLAVRNLYSDSDENIFVLIHGARSSSNIYDTMAISLAMSKVDSLESQDQFQIALKKEINSESFVPQRWVIGIDLRGFGKSEYKQRINTLEDYADDIKLCLEKIMQARNRKLQKNIVLVGLSLGGAIVQQFAAKYTDIVKKVVTINTASPSGLKFLNQNIKEKIKSIEELNNFPILIEAAKNIENKEYEKIKKMSMEKWFNCGKYPVPNERYDRFIEDATRHQDYLYVIFKTYQFDIITVKENEEIKEIQKIKAPILVIYCEDDNVLPISQSQEIIKELPHLAKECVIKNSGHIPMAESYDDCLQCVYNMLKFVC